MGCCLSKKLEGQFDDSDGATDAPELTAWDQITYIRAVQAALDQNHAPEAAAVNPAHPVMHR